MGIKDPFNTQRFVLIECDSVHEEEIYLLPRPRDRQRSIDLMSFYNKIPI